MNKYLVEYLDNALICTDVITSDNIKSALEEALLESMDIISITKILNDAYLSEL